VSKFLSEEWMQQARAIESEFASQGTPPAVQTKINLHITEVPDALSTGDLAACLDTTGGSVMLDLGSFDDADAAITLGYDTAQSFLVEGNQQAMMQAFMGGKIKITGDMTKVLALAAGGSDEVAVAVQARLREITD
jgi:putative sterol carrier protein